MKNIYFFEIIAEICPFFGSENSERKTNNRPQMNGMVFAFIVFANIMNLRVAVVARRDALMRFCVYDLIEFQFSVSAPLFRIPRLQESAAAAATIIVRAVGRHINEVFFSYNRFYHKPEVFRHRIAETLTHQLTRILNSKFDLQILVPVGIDFQFSFPNPLGIILDDTFDFEFERNVEFFQSGPDCKKFMPSLRIEPDFTAQLIHSLCLDSYDLLPSGKILAEQAVVLCCPSFAAVSPVCSDNVENLPQRNHLVRLGNRLSRVLIQK
jgi:hypothetical protein